MQKICAKKLITIKHNVVAGIPSHATQPIQVPASICL